MKSWTFQNFTIHEFDELQSTNSYALELANLRKISDHEIILAHFQNKGRGRKDRQWISPRGNLYFSMVLCPKISLEKILQFSFLAIVALRITIEKMLKFDEKNLIKVKWPNDLLINEKKVAGLLLESINSGKNCEFLIIGIGVNITSNPNHTIFPAGNLNDFNITISPQNLLTNFLDEFEKLYLNYLDFGFAKARRLWLEKVYRFNKNITLKIDEKEINGIFLDLDEEANLLLQTNEAILKISAADIL
jgi:BirA family biotin operon repressor/biotin-[acetyl-CoA-carboxylase] ligase